MDEEDGRLLVKLAREAISEYLSNNRIIKPPPDLPGVLNEKSGVFVTLHTFPEDMLRGCIGIPEPVKPLSVAVIEAAISSAVNDPRFHPLGFQDLTNVTLEVTVLTPPELIDSQTPSECLDSIELGRHGLIIEKGWNRGLLLPQVPLEQGWDKEDFLRGICMKAGLSDHVWKENDTRLYKFEGTVFSEVEPSGAVVKREL